MDSLANAPPSGFSSSYDHSHQNCCPNLVFVPLQLSLASRPGLCFRSFLPGNSACSRITTSSEAYLGSQTMRIQSLLNPFDCGDSHSYRSSESPSPATLPRSVTPYTSAPKRQKIPKDAAIFTDAKVNGLVNFPPYEYRDDEELVAQHRKFQIYPMGNIQKKGARRIPYNSEKKDFMPKTGRDAFEGRYAERYGDDMLTTL